MDSFLKHIENYIRFDEAELAHLRKFIHKRTYEKNEVIFSEGRISNEIYFLTKGCVRLFYNVDGKDKTAFFYTEGKFICAGESYTFNVPAKESYQAIEPSEIYIFTKTNIEKLLKISPRFEILARIATENELILCQSIIASFITKTAEERYQELLENNGDLFNRVPQQYIASFLGVSPETLSRIKKRIFLKKHS